ncbi:unnamed protein product, partial [Ectocarpus sp. 6 AP-2014]
MLLYVQQYFGSWCSRYTTYKNSVQRGILVISAGMCPENSPALHMPDGHFLKVKQLRSLFRAGSIAGARYTFCAGVFRRHTLNCQVIVNTGENSGHIPAIKQGPLLYTYDGAGTIECCACDTHTHTWQKAGSPLESVRASHGKIMEKKEMRIDYSRPAALACLLESTIQQRSHSFPDPSRHTLFPFTPLP